MSSQDKPRPPLPAEALSLPAGYYTDPAHYRAELERFFFGMWIHAGRAHEIPGIGDYVLRDVAGESVIVTRADARRSCEPTTTSAATGALASARPRRAASTA